MNLYTVQLAHHNKAAQMGIPVINVTIKSGEQTFAPSWQMVLAHKDGVSLTHLHLSADEDYKLNFRAMMGESWKNNKARWIEVASMENVAIMCYCKSCNFCHRFLLIDYFRAVCDSLHIPFCYMGEIE